ncbi:LOW QUALITY PROTEIN: arf-GAP with coiled-coil, ANK repeat and PH domain-containing protein 1-like [Guaruba guarouba]
MGQSHGSIPPPCPPGAAGQHRGRPKPPHPNPAQGGGAGPAPRPPGVGAGGGGPAGGAAAPRGGAAEAPLEAREAEAAVGGARGAARARGLDYVLQLNVIQERKKTELLHFVLALLEAQATFFSQGHHRATSTQQYRGQLGVQLDRMELEGARKQRDMEQRHAVLRQQDLSQEAVGGATEAAPGAPPMQGYLYKRASNAFRTWSRRWFCIQSNQLVYIKRARDPPTVVMEDLRLCTAKSCPDLERRFCFEVLSPSKSCVLQADSAAQQRLWLGAVQSAIACAFTGGGPQSAPGQQPPEGLDAVPGPEGDPSGCSVLETVLRVPGNRSCCECREPGPAWASVNLGITLCIQCSGIHRSLGVHFSKVRSLTLDSWEPELVKVMCELGNSTLNRIYEARVEEMGVKRPPPGCSRAQREEWIRAKYVHRKFLPRPLGAPLRPRPPRPGPAPAPPEAEPPPCLHPGALLYWAAQRRCLPTMAEAIAHGADPGWANGAEGNSTPLLQAVAANSLLASEFLLQNGANVNQSDGKGRGPLHHATLRGHTGLACLFLKRGADINAVDAEGKDPLSIAIDLANADIVTLLRLAKMKEMDVAQGQTDATFLDVFRDISLMASDHPEKLARPHSKRSTL